MDRFIVVLTPTVFADFHNMRVAERLAVYAPCPDAQPSKLEGDVLGHGAYTAVELSR
jgi:hypothetical protein